MNWKPIAVLGGFLIGLIIVINSFG